MTKASSPTGALGLFAVVLALTVMSWQLAPLFDSPMAWVAAYQIACVGAPVAVFAIAGRGAFSLAVSLPSPLELALALVIGGALALVNIGLVLPWQPVTPAPRDDVISAAQTLPLALVTLAVIPAVCEELLFRGVLLRALRARAPIIALLASAILFAAFHFSLASAAPTFLVGLVTGALVLGRDNVTLAIAAHLANNAVVLVAIRADAGAALGAPAGAIGVAIVGIGLPVLLRPRAA